MNAKHLTMNNFKLNAIIISMHLQLAVILIDTVEMTPIVHKHQFYTVSARNTAILSSAVKKVPRMEKGISSFYMSNACLYNLQTYVFMSVFVSYAVKLLNKLILLSHN